MTYEYRKQDENFKYKHLPTNDPNGEITGKIVFGLKFWMDEHPEERKRLGWIKCISWSKEEKDEKWPYDPTTQYRLPSMKQIDAYTIEDDYHVIDKTEEMMLLEEMLEVVDRFGTESIFISGDNW